MEKPKRKPIALEALLVSQKLLDEGQWKTVHQFMAENQCNVATAVMFLQMVSPAQLERLVKTELPVGGIQLENIAVNVATKRLIPPEKAKAWQVFPLATLEESGQRVLLLAMTDPLDAELAWKVSQLCRLKVQPIFISLEALQAFYKKHYKIGLDLFPTETSAFHEVTAKRRYDLAATEKPANSSAGNRTPTYATSREIQALLLLLEKKGVLTRKEFERVLNSL